MFPHTIMPSFAKQPLSVQTAIVMGLLFAIGGGVITRDIIAFIMLVVVYGVVVYNTHCLIAGGCVAWSFMQLLWPALFGVALLYSGMVIRKQKDEAVA